MAENVTQELSSPPTPEVGPVEYSNPAWQWLAEGVQKGVDSFALAKMQKDLSNVEGKVDNYYETSLDLYNQIENTPDMNVQRELQRKLDQLQVAEVQGVMSTQAADMRQDAMAREYITRFPHLEEQIQGMMTSIRAGSAGRKKAERLVEDPYIQMREKLFSLSREINIPVPILKDIAQRNYLLEWRMKELQFKKAMGDDLKGSVLLIASERAHLIGKDLLGVISRDSRGRPIGSSGYDTNDAMRRLESAANEGWRQVRLKLQELVEQGIPVDQDTIVAAQTAWQQRIDDLRDLAKDGNNHELTKQRYEIQDLVAFDTLAGGNDMLRLMLKNPQMYPVITGISDKLRSAFAYDPKTGAKTTKEAGFASLVAQARAGVPDAFAALHYDVEAGKLSPRVVDDFVAIYSGKAPTNIFAPGTEPYKIREEATVYEMGEALRKATTPEEISMITQGIFFDPVRETDRNALKDNPESVTKADSLIRSKVLTNPTFTDSPEGKKTVDDMVQVWSDETHSRTVNNPDLPDLDNLTLTGPPTAPFEWRGAPGRTRVMPTGPGGLSGGQALPTNPGADAARYANRVYAAIKSFDPARAEAYKNDLERTLKREVSRRAEGVARIPTKAQQEALEKRTVIDLTDEDFADRQ